MSIRSGIRSGIRRPIRTGVRASDGGEATLSPAIQAKLAAWYKDETDGYVTDQLGYQDRALLSQNSLAGQVFPGRTIEFAGTSQRALVQDNGALDIGSNSAFSMSFWIKFTAFTGFQRLGIGKIVNASTAGEYYFSTGSNSLVFNVRGSGGLSSVSIITGGVTLDTWFHITVNISSTQVITAHVNNVQTGATPTISGTIPSIANTHGFGVNCATTSIASPTGYGGTIQVKDLRIFKGKELSAAERTNCYNGEFVSGFTEWWPLADNSTTRIHSAKNGGLHMTATGISGSSLKTGMWESIYNDYGYAEDATYGQIPPDLSSLTAPDQVPDNDCYGNPLVFKGSAKLHLEKADANTFKMPDGSTSARRRALRAGCDLISLNTWFSGLTAQNVTIADVAQYCGARQFYNAATPELLIVKEGEYLTASQELALLAYTGATIPTSYHASSSTWFARFTNSYSNAQKQKFDNMIRLMAANSALTINDLLYNLVLDEDESKLNFIDTNYTLAPNDTGDAAIVEGKGLINQNNYWVTGFTPSTDAVNLTQNNASIGWKFAIDIKRPTETYNYFQAQNSTLNIYAQAQKISGAWRITIALNANAPATFIIGTSGLDFNKSFIATRTGTTLKLTHNGVTYSNSGNTASTTLVNVSLKLGATYIPDQNYLQHFQIGAYMSDSLALLVSRIIDNYYEGVTAQTDEWIYGADYKYKLSDKFILDRIGDQILWGDGFNLYYSTDNGATISSSIAFDTTVYGYPTMCHMFDNGKIIFATFGNLAFKTTTALTSIVSADILDSDGSPYVPHTPANAAFPGEYFRFLGINQKMYLDDDTEIFVWNNYCNNLTGAAPCIVWYSFGDDFKIAYEFGQNPYFRDDGTNDGGTTGTLLGDAGNTNLTRHGHGVSQDIQSKNDFYGMYGDLDRADPFYECQVMKYVYDQGLDTFTPSIIKKDSRYTRFKMTSGQMPGDGNFYWSSDTDDATPLATSTEKGFFVAPIASIADTGTHTRLYKPLQDRPVNIFHYDGDFFLEGGYAVGGSGGGGIGLFGSCNIMYSRDMVTFTEVTLNIPGSVYIQRITKISHLVYQIDIIGDYSFLKNTQSVIIDFN